MDDTQKEFYDVVFRLLTCQDSNALAAPAAFEQHAAEHSAERRSGCAAPAFRRRTAMWKNTRPC
jgi:hypothetical protein